ncbi:hypothetical protein AB0451_38010, partial [Streptomyces sp. NPDC052000]
GSLVSSAAVGAAGAALGDGQRNAVVPDPEFPRPAGCTPPPRASRRTWQPRARTSLRRARCPPPATALDKPVGQWLTNCRRPDGLGKDPKRAKVRAEQLAAVDPEWNPAQLGWTVDWQRHHVGLQALQNAGAHVAGIVPGVG